MEIQRFCGNRLFGINEMIDHGMGDLQQVSALANERWCRYGYGGRRFLTTLKNLYKKGKY